MRSDRRRLFLAGAAVVLLAAACQPLPRPFKPETGRDDNPLLYLADAGGIHVRAVDGAPEPVSGMLAQAMSDALLSVGIPASTGPANELSLFLHGHARARHAGDDRMAVELVWELLDHEGAKVGRYAQRAVVPRAAWTGAGDEALAGIARSAAPRIAALVRGPPRASASAAEAAPAAAAPVYVGAVTGAPGDGNRALPEALRAALFRAGVALSMEPRKDGVVIEGQVRTSAAGNGREDVAIVWTVRDAAGAALGTLEQRNAVAPGALDGAWGRLARLVAEAAVGGVLEILRKLPAAGAPAASGPG